MSEFVDPLNLYLQRYQINTIARMSVFFGQAEVETAGLSMMTEDLNYATVERLHKVYSTLRTDPDVKHYLNDPMRLANRVYAGKSGNGDVASGDGWLYRGRGLFHLTGKKNYLDFAAHCGVAVDRDPDLLAQPSYAVQSACWYWQHHRLSPLADAGSIEALIRRVNRGMAGAERRIESAEKTRRILRDKAVRMGVM